MEHLFSSWASVSFTEPTFMIGTRGSTQTLKLICKLSFAASPGW